MSSIISKVKDAVAPSHHNDNNTTSSSAPEGTHGPHSSRAANAADPRVDSDRDHRAAPGSTVGGSHGYASSDNYTHSSTGPTAGSREGPHGSNMANKMDPRIDSDRSGTKFGNTAGDQYGSGREGQHGPHSSRLANAVDPRVDSDRDASRTVGNTYGSSGTSGNTGTYGTGAIGSHGTSGLTSTHETSGTHGTSGLTGTHGSSGTHGTSGLTGTHPTSGAYGTTGSSGPGPASNTAGPHSSNMANKLDPRVDSDLDGSKTVGGNKTYSS
ncbi:hypothetical protein DL762_006945 [Monosporascus cannonballus]|uniref:Cell surface protein n=1 Tax=Monosporascus cannonballus TaxID=155416 RepID=A0ABY0H0Z5_9PEZI|nr:hypothetical protein DL762_006945 [Monosporascus cannonballus]